MSTFNVVIGGTASLDHDPKSVADRLATLFKISQEKAEALLVGHHVIKRGIDETTAERYRDALTKIGVRCEIRPEAAAASTVIPPKVPAASVPTPVARPKPVAPVRPLPVGPRTPPPRIPTISKATSTSESDSTLPPGVRGWSWGAFLLNGFWAIGNRTWIGLLAFIPVVGWIMAIALGIKGREWAWKARRWDSVEQFDRVQRKWSQWGVIITVVGVGLAILIGIQTAQYEKELAQGSEPTQELPSLASRNSTEQSGAVDGSAPAASDRSTLDSADAKPTVAAPRGDLLAKVFNGDMLNTRIAYFESIAGIARMAEGDHRQYRVNGCDVTATVASGQVTALRLELKPGCQVDLVSFLRDFSPPSGQPFTFGAFARQMPGIAFYADCLESCGNANDPSVFGYWEGPHALNFLEVLLEVTLVDDTAIQAASVWEGAMEKAKGRDWVEATRFNCDRSFDDAALKSFCNVQLTAITIGIGLEKPECPSNP